MRACKIISRVALAFFTVAGAANALAAEVFRVATYNLENYLDVAEGTRRVKSPEARAVVVQSILAVKPDIIALEEMGSTNALLELQASLKAAGLNLPHWEHITAADTNIHIALLSRFPFVARDPHTNENFLLNGRRFRVSRGFAEVECQVNAKYRFTLIAAHLKSRIASPLADEEEMREEEAVRLRQLIGARLEANPRVNLVVVGDFNDLRDSKAVRAVLGRGKNALFDTRPGEPNGGAQFRPITWTFHYSKEDVYSRIDYILLSPGMKLEWLPQESYVLNLPNWGVASDHRPVVCAFEAEEKR